jgi:hypothetical protein
MELAAMTFNVYRARLRGMPGPGLTEEQQAAVDRTIRAAISVDTFVDRNAIASPPYGLWVYVVEGARWYVWTEDGLPVDPEEPEGARMDGWVGQRTDAELQATLDGAFDAINLNLGNINTELVKRQATLDTFAQLGAITGEYLYYGRHVFVVEGGRWYSWTKDGNGPGVDAWKAYQSREEQDNNVLASEARDAALSDRIDAIQPAEIASFASTPANGELGATTSSLALVWSILTEDGTPLAQKISWGGNIVHLDGSARSLTIPPPAWAAQTQALVIGDSLSSPGYSDLLATATGLTVTRVALGAQTSYKQALRVGAQPLYVTLSGNTLPASGTEATVDLLNGAAPNVANPASILTTADGDPSALYQIAGAINGVAVTMLHRPATAPNVYKMTQTGGAPVTVPAGSLFVPDWSAAMHTHELWICVGRNNVTDPARIRADITAMIRMARGQRILLFGIINAPNEPTGSANLATIKALNDWMRATWPQYYVVDGSGRDLRQALLASGGTTGDDLTDRNNEVIPRSLRVAADDLHLNSTGYGIWATMAQAFRAGQAAPATSIADGTVITLNANGRLRQLTFTKLPRRYWGVSANTALTGAQVIALAGSELSAGRAKAFSVAAADQHVYFSYLASLGDPTGYAIGGFAEGYVKAVVSVTTAAGHTADYIVIRSTNKLTGTVPVEVK